MLIRPQETLPGDFQAIKNKINNDYNTNTSVWQVYWTEATIDTRLEAGDTSLMADTNTTMANNNQGSYYFNRVRPLLSMVSGQQRRNRKSSIVVPLENGDQETADQWSKILLHLYKRENIYETISEAFYQGACITGMNLLHLYLDFQDDPVSGDLKVENCAYNTFFIDPYFRKTDLSDCNFVWKRTFLTHSAAANLLPNHAEEIMSMSGNPTGTGRDGRFQYMPESYGQSGQNKVAYDEYYYRDYRKEKKLIDKNTGASIDLEEISSQIDIDEFMANYGDKVFIHEQMIPTVRLAIMVQDNVLYDGPNPLGLDSFPFTPIIGYYNPMMPYFYTRIQGLARSLRDPQMLYNRRVILNMDLAESVANTGWIFKENAIVDVKHLFQTGQGRIIPLKMEAQMTDLQQIPAPNVPPSYFKIEEGMRNEMNAVTGINEELMGMASDAKAGITEVLRQGAGLVTLQPLFDRLDHSQVQFSELMMEAVRKNYTPAKIKRILEGQEPEPFFYNKGFGKYHCSVELGFNTDTQKQMQYAQLLQLRELGIPIPDEFMVDSATIQDKKKLQDFMAQQAQAAQEQQQQQLQIQAESTQAQARLYNARAEADTGLGIERMSRVAENHALSEERKAKAVKDENDAVLSLARALKEMEGLDIEHLEKLITLQKMVALEKPEKEPDAISSQPSLGMNALQNLGQRL